MRQELDELAGPLRLVLVELERERLLLFALAVFPVALAGQADPLTDCLLALDAARLAFRRRDVRVFSFCHFPLSSGWSVGRDLVECAAVAVKRCFLAGERLPALDYYVAILRLNLQAQTVPPFHLGCDGCGAAPEKWIVYRLPGA